ILEYSAYDQARLQRSFEAADLVGTAGACDLRGILGAPAIRRHRAGIGEGELDDDVLSWMAVQCREYVAQSSGMMTGTLEVAVLAIRTGIDRHRRRSLSGDQTSKKRQQCYEMTAWESHRRYPLATTPPPGVCPPGIGCRMMASPYGKLRPPSTTDTRQR